MDPIDRSMPPVMMTRPSPSANRPKRPIWFARFIRLTWEMNCGLMAAVTPPITRISRASPSSFLSMGGEILVGRLSDGEHQDIVLGKILALQKAADATLV